MPLCKHQVRPMAWSPRRAQTCLAPFRALPFTTTVTTRIGGGEPCIWPQLPLSTDSLKLFQTGMLESDLCSRLFVAAVLMSLDCSELSQEFVSENFHIHRHSFPFFPSAYTHARIHTHSLYMTFWFVRIHSLHSSLLF